MSTKKFDIVIAGAGIVGLASAMNLLRTKRDLKIAILEKEDKIALHQTGNNSGVIHSGIYYKPGSQKAVNCKLGYDKMLQFAKENDIPYDICGKIIVATQTKELASLENIYNRGVANGLNGIKKISAEETKEIEPYVHSIESVWVPQAGIIDYKKVAAKYAEIIQELGGEIYLGHKILGVKESQEGVHIETENQTFFGKKFINACGLYSDKITKMTNREADVQIIPFRGEYYVLNKKKEYLVKNLIYPVPDPQFPFLGVHFTRMINGGIEAGPNAVLAFAREGYKKTDINFGEFWETLRFSGFRKIAQKYWKEGAEEMYRSWSKNAFCKALQALIPEIQIDDIEPGNAGIRAQACDSKGNLVDDFLIYESNAIVNVCNAPSPAATASIAIGEQIAERTLKSWS
jgi:L-2-hydroxyglutarate oxidase